MHGLSASKSQAGASSIAQHVEVLPPVFAWGVSQSSLLLLLQHGVECISDIAGLRPLGLTEFLDDDISVDEASSIIALAQVPASPLLEKLAARAFDASNTRRITRPLDMPAPVAPARLHEMCLKPGNSKVSSLMPTAVATRLPLAKRHQLNLDVLFELVVAMGGRSLRPNSAVLLDPASAKEAFLRREMEGSALLSEDCCP